MKEVIFKIKDNRFNIHVDDDLTNNEFLELLNHRLQRFMILKNDFKKEVILNMTNRSLNDREILQLFDILNDVNIFYLNKVICKNEFREHMTIYKGNIRAGQNRFFKNSALIVGTLNPGSKVIVNGDLYILGKINGDIELRNHDSKIYCGTICKGIVKIGDVSKLYEQELSNKEIYLQDNEIMERDYNKGEIISGKSNSCYIG